MTDQPLGSFVKPRDALFHQPPFNEPTWLETNWFSFLVPSHNMRGHIVMGFRGNLGVVFSNIMVWSKDAPRVLDLDYYDARIHVPMPRQNLDHYSLESGITVTMRETLKTWDLQYRGFGDTRFDLHFEALMPAIDSREIGVPGGKDFSHFHATKSMLREAVGHIDQSQMVTGTIVIRGEEIEVAYPSNHDHSWGPRPKYGHAMGNFDEGYFGKDLIFHVQTINPDYESGAIINGYIVKGGDLRRLKAGEARYKMSGWRTERIEYDLEDERGETYRIVGEPTATAWLPAYPNQFIHGAVTKWTCDGETGWGESKWHWEVSEMQRAGEPPQS